MPRVISVFWAAVILIAANVLAQSYSFSHFAGTTGGASYQDAVGTAARFSFPTVVAIDKNGNVYVGEYDTLRRISATGNVTTFGGKWHNAATTNGQGGSARFSSISGLTVDSAGNVFVS